NRENQCARRTGQFQYYCSQTMTAIKIAHVVVTHVILSTSRALPTLLCRPTNNVASGWTAENMRPDFRNPLCLSTLICAAATPFQCLSDRRFSAYTNNF